MFLPRCTTSPRIPNSRDRGAPSWRRQLFSFRVRNNECALTTPLSRRTDAARIGGTISLARFVSGRVIGAPNFGGYFLARACKFGTHHFGVALLWGRYLTVGSFPWGVNSGPRASVGGFLLGRVNFGCGNFGWSSVGLFWARVRKIGGVYYRHRCSGLRPKNMRSAFRRHPKLADLSISWDFSFWRVKWVPLVFCLWAFATSVIRARLAWASKMPDFISPYPKITAQLCCARKKLRFTPEQGSRKSPGRLKFGHNVYESVKQYILLPSKGNP